METEGVHDSPRGWVNRHIREYVESGGERGHRWMGKDALLLTTRGRTSGRLRRTALIYGVDGERFVLVASNGGAKRHPHWYRNLEADPNVRLQVGAEEFDARARATAGAERRKLWGLMVGILPAYEQYAERAGREIPVVVVERS